MRAEFLRQPRTTIVLSVAIGGWLACSPTASENQNNGGGVGMGGRNATGGAAGATSGGAGGGSGGVAGNGGAVGSGGATSGGGATGSGGATSSGGSSGGGAPGGAGGTAGNGTDAGAGAGGAGGSGGSTGTARDAASEGSTGDTVAPGGAVTFTKVFTEVLVPGCSAPNGACHSVARDQYFLFAEGQQARSHMLLVPTAATVGTIPSRVNTLLSYASPTMAGNPNSVRMPPQSGANLGNPPVRKPPLTTEQLALIRTWAMTGAKND
jgi:hypothetical protein